MTSSSKAYLDIPDRRDSPAVHIVLEGIISVLQSGTLNVNDRSSLLRAIVEDLCPGDDSIWKSWDKQAYEEALECVKILSRGQAGSSYLASTTGIKTLQYHAQIPLARSTPPNATKSQQLAISAICNTLLLHSSAPEICIKEGLGDWAVRELELETRTQVDETWAFLMARVIMVLTSRASYGFLGRLVDEMSFLQIIQARLQDDMQRLDRSSLAVIEYLKILYHIFALYPESQGRDWDERFNVFSPLLLDYLLACSTDRLESPITNIINVLTRFPPKALHDTVSDSDRLANAANVILDVTMAYVRATLPPPPWKPGDALPCPSFNQQLVVSLDETLPPAFLALVNLMHSDSIVRRKIKKQILPPDLDRSITSGPLDERPDVLGYLLRLARSALNHVTAAAAGEVLYVACGENAATLSDEIGYGNAAGILFHKGMGPPPKPEATIEEIPDEGTVSDEAARNPITGLLEKTDETRHPTADMTQEEKEREAERMMALFDRMEKNPAMQLVENPMKDAVRSGKIDEWERSEQDKELQRIREQEAEDEAEAAKESSEWKKRMGKT